MTASAEEAAAPSLVIAEVIERTVQGEGPSTGRQASFIRLGGCNLSCAWCDQAETWDADRYDLRETLTRTPVQDIAARALAARTPIVVITGGEPLLHQHQPAWTLLLDTLLTAGAEVEVETNGTVAPTMATADRVTRWNVSPKLAHAGDPEAKRINGKALAILRWTERAVFKFVCRDAGDVAEAARFALTQNIPERLVWIMPEGIDNATITARLQDIADPAIAAGFNLSHRLHVACFGSEKGR